MNFEKFKTDLAKYLPGRIIFAGLGNEIRGDDYAGILFLNELKKQEAFAESKFLNVGTNPENYLMQFTSDETEVIVFIDAVETNGGSGKIEWLDSSQINLISVSTHSFSIKMVEEYINSVHPVEFMYLGLSAASYGYGNTISDTLKKSITDFFTAS